MAGAIGSRPVSSFLSASSDQLEQLVEDTGEPLPTDVREQWFESIDGFHALRSLIDHIAASNISEFSASDHETPSPLAVRKKGQPSVAAVLEDLRAMAVVLEKASELGVRFHLTAEA
jgi:hypothetical protein